MGGCEGGLSDKDQRGEADDFRETTMKISDSRIVVTGGGGLIGSTIVENLVDAGAGEVTVVETFDRGNRSNLDRARHSNRFRLVEGDICDRDLMREELRRADGLIHMAALRITQCVQEPERTRQVMFEAPYNLFWDAADLKVKQIVYASSSSIYGQADSFPTNELHHPYNDRTIYGAGKMAAEGILRAFEDMYGLSYTAMRFFNVYGPRMDVHGVYTEVMVRWMERIAEGLPPIIFGDGSQSMDFTYVEDAARACTVALASEARGEVFNIGTGRSTSLRDLAGMLAVAMGRPDLQPEFQPARSVSPVNYRLADISKAEKLLGFRPEVPLEEGLRRLVQWWRAVTGRTQAAAE
jgi:UDP-glucose 4-epimerase